MPKQYFELIDNDSSKFWHAELKGDTQTVLYGRIGTEGRETTKSFASPAVAKLAFEKLIQQKTAKGYVKVLKKRGASHTPSGASKDQKHAATKPVKKAVAKTVPGSSKKLTTKQPSIKATKKPTPKKTPSKTAELDTGQLLKLLKKKARGADEIALKKKLKAAKPTASKSQILRLAGKWEATEVVKAMAAANVNFNSAAGTEFYTFNAAITKLMLESGYNAKQLADQWLRSAVTHGKTPVVQLLLDGGAKATPTGPKSISLLAIAIENNRLSIANLLLEAGADANKPSYKGDDSPLMEACKNGNLKLVKLLLDAGAKVDYKDQYGFDALMTSLQHSSADALDIAKLLIGDGADVNRQTKNGWTPLMWAARQSNETTIKFLIKQGADPKCVTKMGTPLTSAAQDNNAAVIPLLLKAGVDPNWKYGPKEPEHLRGRNALDVAKDWKARRVIPLLEQAMNGGKPTTAKKATKPKIGTVAQSWKRIEAWLKTNDPERFKSLSKPAKVTAISKLEKAVGSKLPKEVLQSYQIHNGQSDFASLVVDDESGSYCLLPVNEMLSEWEVWDELIKYGEFEGDLSQPAKGIRGDKWFNLKWIPFMSNGGGDSYCIDMDPAKGGKVGQIITMNHEHGRRELLASSMKEFLGRLAHDLENGLMDYEEE